MRTAKGHLDRLAEAWHEVNPAFEVRRLAVRLLRTHPLRAADAFQLAAALALAGAGLDKLSFVSADARLNEAAEIENLIVAEA